MPGVTDLARAAFWFGVAAVTVLSLLPQPALPVVDASDKVQHVAAYFLLAVAGGLAYRGKRMLLVAAGLTLLGGALELAQSVVPGRSASWGDVLADLVGIAIGIAMATVVARALSSRAARRAAHPGSAAPTPAAAGADRRAVRADAG